LLIQRDGVHAASQNAHSGTQLDATGRIRATVQPSEQAPSAAESGMGVQQDPGHAQTVTPAPSRRDKPQFRPRLLDAQRDAM
jgi:hypothetical protein